MKTKFTHQPRIEGNDFPRDSRLASYALALLELDQLGRFLLEIIFYALPHGTGQEIAEQIGRDFSDDQLIENLTEASNKEDVARAFTSFLGPPKSKKSVYFIKLVVPYLKQKINPTQKSYQRRTEQVCAKLNLNSDEITLLELGCCYRISKGLEHIVDSYDYTQKISFIAHLTSIPYSCVSAMISKNSRLAKNDLLNLRNRNLDINEETSYFLLGISGKEFAAAAFKTAPKPELPIDAFGLTSIQRETLHRLLQSDAPAHLLFYGKPGTGKTELAKALGPFCQRKSVCVDCGSDGDESDRKTALLVTENSVPEETIIIVDEVDVLLNTRHLFRETKVNKGWINHFLDNSKHKIIWITNDISSIEESVRRRFSYSLQFKQLTWQQRATIWQTQLRKHRIKRFFQTPDIQQLAKRFPVSPGLIAYSVKTMKQCRTPDMPVLQVHAMLDEVLTRQMELTEGVKPEKKLNSINENYDPDALNTDADIPRLIQGLESFQALEAGYGMNLLFWGWPGTGKTEFGKHIAEQLGKELLVKRMSDLQSKWVGETEKLIAAAFREAEENDAILFLDEADSLFINRQTANRSWETSQTNEILTQMENFSGILICCTNLLENLDEAAMRRFAFKIKFLPLTDDGKLRLYRNYFSSVKGSFLRQHEAALSKVRNLCPGDIKAVWQRTCVMGRLESLPHMEIIAELEKEVSYKRGGNKAVIGFG